MQNTSTIAIPQQAFDWYDEYARGGIDRRTFMARLATLTVVGLNLGTLMGALLPNYALAEQVAPNDEAIKTSYLEFASPNGNGQGRGYLVIPSQLQGKGPVVLVVHENRGLNPYIMDVARRLGKAGFIAFAPDALFTLGGYPGNDDEGRKMQEKLNQGKIAEDFKAAAQVLKKHERSNGKLGVVGFCFGGYITNLLAATLPDVVNAAVPFYGTAPSAEQAAEIKAPLLLHFAGLDERVNATWPDYEAVLKAHKVKYKAYIYPNTNHGFHNDSTARYDEKAAELAWSRTIEFFNQYLKS